MTLEFPGLKKLMDYLHASHIANCELSTTKFTLTFDFLRADIDLASTYGATVVDDNTVTHPNKGNRSSNHT